MEVLSGCRRKILSRTGAEMKADKAKALIRRELVQTAQVAAADGSIDRRG